MKADLFQSCGHCWVFQICWHIECNTLTASSFRIWNSSAGILSPPLALFTVMLPKSRLTWHSRISESRWVTTSSWLSRSLRPFLYSSSVYSCHLFLIFSALVRSLPFLSYIVPIFVWYIPLVSPIILKRSLVFHILLFPLFLCIVHMRRLSSISLLFSGTLHSVGYLPLSPLPFASLLFSASKAFSDNCFAFLHFFSLGMILITTSCTMLWTSIHSSSGILSTRSNPLSLLITTTV